MVLPVLYSFRRCPYAMRARMAVLASGQSCELREVLLGDKPAELLTISPKATVPVLVDVDNRVVDESLDIMLWALRKNDPEQWLPIDETVMSDALCLIKSCDGPFKQALDRYKYPMRYADIDPGEQRDLGASFLRGLQARLHDRTWFGGERPGLADYAIMPFVRQYSMVEPDWFHRQDWSELHRWLQVLGDSSMFARAMEKHPVWRSGQSGSMFPATAATGTR